MASQLVEGTGGPSEGPPPAMPHMVWTPDWGQAVPSVETAAAWPLISPCPREGRADEMPSFLLTLNCSVQVLAQPLICCGPGTSPSASLSLESGDPRRAP